MKVYESRYRWSILYAQLLKNTLIQVRDLGIKKGLHT